MNNTFKVTDEKPYCCRDTEIGISYILLAIVALMFYTPCMVVIYRRMRDTTESTSCYKLMFFMGVADYIQLAVLGFAAGIMSLAFSSVPFWLSKVCGAFAGAAFQNYLFHLLLLSFNRYISICYGPQWQAHYFGDSTMRMWLAVSWIYAGVWFVLLLSPVAGMHYIRPYNAFYYGLHIPSEYFNGVLMIFGFCAIITVCLLGSIFYALIIKNIHLMKSMVNPISTAAVSIAEKERRTLLSSATIFGYFLIGSTFFFIIPAILTDQNRYLIFYLSHMSWYANALINPVVYLTLNNSIKKRVWKMMWSRLSDNATVYNIQNEQEQPHPLTTTPRAV